MKLRWIAVPAAAAVMMFAGQANAAMDQTAALALAKKSGCLACHSIEKKVVGPAWQDVANKYKGADEKARLIAKVKAGGKGVWGEVPMPPYSPRVADADIEGLVDFVLSLAK